MSTSKRPASKTATPVPAPTPAAIKKPRVDWEAVERDFRVGKMTFRELSEKHGSSPGGICQKAKDRSWVRGDLQSAVNQATQALLVAKQVQGEVNKVKRGLNDSVLAAAELNSQVIMRHRARVGRAVDVTMRMLEELDSTTLKTDELNNLFSLFTSELNGPELQSAQQQFREFMKLHARVGSAQKLMGALKDAQVLEAQAFGNLYEVKKGPSDLELLSDDEMTARINELKAKLGL